MGTASLIASVLGLLVAAAAFGHLAAPALLVAPEDIAAGGALGKADKLPRGTAALEAAFWLTALASAVTSFRVMEILYRRADLRAVDPYPLELAALYVDRLLAALLEAAATTVGISAFFVPLVWHGAPNVAAICILVVATGLTASSIVSVAIQVAAGQMNARAARGDGGRNLGDAYGGPGQVFMFSPGIALAVCALLVLLARLAAGDLLEGTETLRGFTFGYGLIGLAVVASLIDSFRRFVGGFPDMAARFREADTIQYEAHLDYQTSAYRQSSWYEVLVPESARPAFRTALLQYGRAHMLARYSYVIGWVLAGFALSQWSRSAFPPWAVVCAPAVVAATVANPWQRLVRPPLRPQFARYLPVSERSNTVAMMAIALRELLLMVGPYAALVIWVDSGSTSAATVGLRAGASLLLAVGLNGLVALYWRLAKPDASGAFVVPLAGAAVAIAIAVASIPAATIFAGVAALANAAPFVGGRHERAQNVTSR
jgi:hypothetical protein